MLLHHIDKPGGKTLKSNLRLEIPGCFPTHTDIGLPVTTVRNNIEEQRFFILDFRGKILGFRGKILGFFEKIMEFLATRPHFRFDKPE